jgi:hypothetical protein
LTKNNLTLKEREKQKLTRVFFALTKNNFGPLPKQGKKKRKEKDSLLY